MTRRIVPDRCFGAVIDVQDFFLAQLGNRTLRMFVPEQPDHAIGLRDGKVVAVDTTSLYPWRAVAPLPKVGYLRQLSVEGILSTKPDLILADIDDCMCDVKAAAPDRCFDFVGE